VFDCTVNGIHVDGNLNVNQIGKVQCHKVNPTIHVVGAANWLAESNDLLDSGNIELKQPPPGIDSLSEKGETPTDDDMEWSKIVTNPYNYDIHTDFVDHFLKVRTEISKVFPNAKWTYFTLLQRMGVDDFVQNDTLQTNKIDFTENQQLQEKFKTAIKEHGVTDVRFAAWTPHETCDLVIDLAHLFKWSRTGPVYNPDESVLMEQQVTPYQTKVLRFPFMSPYATLAPLITTDMTTYIDRMIHHNIEIDPIEPFQAIMTISKRIRQSRERMHEKSIGKKHWEIENEGGYPIEMKEENVTIEVMNALWGNDSDLFQHL
tara:strand:- start:175 stop:1125 length:951 start_codon:yes stop_codon:yes gene_type:complete